ncbi:hypothetical protein WN944_006324 [Citrus x changshan-huyou]|uniref:Uncharacterized protein n=1 Tax=Citrus x changshan-huyou TaxID=2935761 RepID=A0AAP0QTE3_9ROSI
MLLFSSKVLRPFRLNSAFAFLSEQTKSSNVSISFSLACAVRYAGELPTESSGKGSSGAVRTFIACTDKEGLEYPRFDLDAALAHFPISAKNGAHGYGKIDLVYEGESKISEVWRSLVSWFDGFPCQYLHFQCVSILGNHI